MNKISKAMSLSTKKTYAVASVVALVVMLAGCTRNTNPAVTPVVEPPATQQPSLTAQEQQIVDTLTTPEAPLPEPQESLPAPAFGTQTKSAHFVSSNPAHEDILSSAPDAVVFTFNFDIEPASTVSVKSASGTEYAVGDPIVGADLLTLTQNVSDLPPGDYTVSYSACWPDQTCHPGQFEFAIR